MPERSGKVVCRKINRDRQALCSDTMEEEEEEGGKRRIAIETILFEGQLRVLNPRRLYWGSHYLGDQLSAHTAWNRTKPGVCTKCVHLV